MPVLEIDRFSGSLGRFRARSWKLWRYSFTGRSGAISRVLLTIFSIGGFRRRVDTAAATQFFLDQDACMFPELNPVPAPEVDVEHAVVASDWNTHEHVSNQVQIQAAKLLDLVGSPELAKYAIAVVEQTQNGVDGDPTTSEALNNVEVGDRYSKALVELENALAAPVHDGHLADWVTAIHKAAEYTGALLRDNVCHKHSALFAAVACDATEMAKRVERLREADQQIESVDFPNFQRSLKQLVDETEAAGLDEVKALPLRADVVKNGRAFVASAQTQEAMVAACFGEPLERQC